MEVKVLKIRVADSFIGNKTLGVNIILTFVYLLGISLSWYGLRMK